MNFVCSFVLKLLSDALLTVLMNEMRQLWTE